MNVIIVGAGPSGSYAAFLLAKQGHTVAVFEEHETIGKPIQCTGIVTKALFTLVPKDDYILNKVESIKIHGPSTIAEMPLEEYIICRHTFDTWLARRAMKQGVKYHLKHRFVRHKNGKAVFRYEGKEVSHSYDLLIGADGAGSAVRKSLGVKQQRVWVGVQATIASRDNPKQFETWFGSEYAPQFFGWSVPESATRSRVGVACAETPRTYFERLHQKKGGKILEMQGGPIPIYQNQPADYGNVKLVGDAGSLVKATTGGGIITGMLSAEALAKSIKNNTSYEKELEPLRKELRLHLWMRKMLNHFSDKDYDKLIRLMDNQKVQKILYKHPREFPSKFLVKLVIAEPRLLAFGTRIPHIFF